MNPCTVESIEHTPDGLLVVIRAHDTGRQYVAPIDITDMAAAIERATTPAPTPEPTPPLPDVTDLGDAEDVGEVVALPDGTTAEVVPDPPPDEA